MSILCFRQTNDSQGDDLQTGNDDTKRDLNSIGSIIIESRHVASCRPATATREPPLPNLDSIPEKALKGISASHITTYVSI
jgi:hypothetical protein